MASRSLILGPAAVIVALVGSSLGAPALAQDAPDALSHDRAAQVGDLYAFVSPDRPDTATIITTWGGPQEPSEWATQAWFDPALTYWIKLDNTGDGVADITYTFRFLTQVDAPDSILATGFGTDPGHAGDRQPVGQRHPQWRDAHERRGAARQHRSPDDAGVSARCRSTIWARSTRTSPSNGRARSSLGSAMTLRSWIQAPWLTCWACGR